MPIWTILVKTTINRKQQFLSLLILGLVYPLNIIHELGHAFICSLYNQKYELTLSIFERSNVICVGNEINKTVYGITGGTAVMIFMIGIFFIPQVRKNIGARISIVSIIFVSFINAILEGFLFDFYNQNLIISEVFLLLILLSVFSIQWIISIRK